MAATEHGIVQELAAGGLREPPQRYVLSEDKRPSGTCCTGEAGRQLPAIDIQKLRRADDGETARFRAALESWGLFLAINHEIPQQLLQEVRDAARGFFELPPEEKQKYSNLVNGKEFQFEGYGNDKDAGEDRILDWNDRLYLNVYPEDERKYDLWPTDPASFRAVLEEFSKMTKVLVEDLLRIMARQLELDEEYLVEQMGSRAGATARFNWYPPCARPDLVLGMKPHSDSTMITVILPDGQVGGLQVLQDGAWVDVATAVPGLLIIFLGDLSEIVTNGAFKSPLHRVVTSAEKERLSIVMFFAAELSKEVKPAEALVSRGRPAMYRAVNFEEYLPKVFETLAGGPIALDTVRLLQ